MAKEVWEGEVAKWQAKGYVTAMHCAAPHQNGVTYGGTAILSKMPGTLGILDLPPELQARWPGRITAARFFPPNASRSCILVGAYAPFIGPQGEADNRQFIEDLFAYLAELDGSPLLLAADLNRDAAHPMMDEIFAGGRWHDLLMTAHGQRGPTTCDARYGDGGRAIDHLIGNTAMTTTLRTASVMEEAIVTHYPITASFNWDGQHKVLTMNDCRRLPEEAHKPLPQEGLPTWAWPERHQQYQQALRDQNVEQATQEWMRRWELLLIARVRHHNGSLTAAMQGRWKLRPPSYRLRGRSRRQNEQTDYYQKLLTRIRNLLIEKQRRVQYGDTLTPRQEQELAARLAQSEHLLPPPPLPPPAVPEQEPRDVPAVAAEGMEAEQNPLDMMGMHRPAQPLPAQDPGPALDPDLAIDPVGLLLQRVRRALQQREALIRRARVRRWQQQLQDVKRAGTTKCHAYIRGKRLTALQRLRNAAGEIVTLPEDLHTTLRQAWQVIDTPAQPLTPQEMEALMHDYAACYQQHDWGETTITTQHIKSALSRARTTASPGRGSWSIPDLRSLPAQAHEELAALLCLWDACGPPQCLAEIYVTMIPKEHDNPDPMALRPISVAPLLLRLWTTIKVRSWAQRISQSIPQEQHGGVPARSVVQLVAEMSVDLEASKVYDQQMMGISYDFAKFFDSLPPQMIGPILRAAGAPAQWAERYMHFILSLRYRYRFLDNTTGPEFKKQCGIPQGDAMSVVVALLMLVALTQSLVRAADGAAEIRMYLDDLTVRTRHGAVLDTVDNEVREYARRWGIKLSPKSIAFATDRAHHNLLRRINHPVVEEFKWLGTFHHLCSRDRPQALKAFTTKVATTRTRLKRLQWAHLPWNLRQHLISTNVMAGPCWYPLGQPVEEGVLKSLELSVFYAMFNTNPKALQKAAREAFWCFLVKGHRMHATAARAFAMLACLRRLRPEYQHRLRQLWERSATTGQLIRQGLMDTTRHLCRAIGLEIDDNLNLTTDQEPPLPLFGPHTAKEFQHHLRGMWRTAQQRALEQRRPHYAGLLELGGVNGHLVRKWIGAMTTTTTTTTRCPSQPTTARLMVCNAHRTAEWASTHVLVAGERKYEATCPNCDQNVPENLHHMVWDCPRWMQQRSFGATYDSLHDLPDPVRRTLLPTMRLTVDQVNRLYLAFRQAVQVIDAHTREGGACREYQRRRVVGKRQIHQIQNALPMRPPRGGPIDLGNHGGHQLVEIVHQGAPSYQCQTCGMRARRQYASWFLKRPCGPPVHRRKDLRVCPQGMRDVICSASGTGYCLCLWCGTADKQRSNLIRRHSCWEGPLRIAIQTHRASIADHVEVLCALGEHVQHEMGRVGDRKVCLLCGKSTIGRSLKGSCRPSVTATYNLTEAELRAALIDSSVLFQ